jgi:DNA-binding winged helix-turn-helix (wHTH) protein
MDYRTVPPGDGEAETQLLNWPWPSALPGPQDSRPWDEQVPAPGGDATLLAVMPIPGTGTSLAIVGYVIPAPAGDTAPGLGAVAAGPGAAGPGGPGPAGVGPAEPAAGRSSRRKRSAVSGLRLDHVQRRVWIDGHEIGLTFQEFELLAFLAAHPATVFTRADLVGHVWHRNLGADGRPVPQDSRTVDVHVSRVRRKLGPRYGQYLVTEYRVGYQFRPPPP